MKTDSIQDLRRMFAGFSLIGLLICSGCTTRPSSKELARVAKDWCLSIRASQVIPVYPLSEDVLPGDIFLVQRRIEDQVAEYEKRGFLPLDQLLGRVHPEKYGEFYLKSYGIGTNTDTPYHWKFPGDPSRTNELAYAPRAGFPSYSFQVKRGAGLNVAIPVDGVPVALGLLGSGSAHGEITISDASTFGIDIISLRKQVEQWAKKSENKKMLLELAPDSTRTNYLRIVNRVFWTSKVNVSLRSDKAFSGSASGGAAREVSLFDAGDKPAAENYTNAIAQINEMLSKTDLPGGTLKVASASEHVVSMDETFPRPLVIGYLGFDLPILEDGYLGTPISTQAVVENRAGTEFSSSVIRRISTEDEQVDDLIELIRSKDEPQKLDSAQLKKAIKGTPLQNQEEQVAKMNVEKFKQYLMRGGLPYVSVLSKNLREP